MKAQTPSPTPADEFTIVALPDTQFYSSLNPQIFAAQTQWIADHVQDQNIQLVVGLGDIVDGGSVLTQWQNADAAVRLLSGKVPYMMAIGNHDYDQNIQLVIGLGDIVDGGGSLPQWQNADAAVRLLNGKVPYMMAIGNHDYAYVYLRR